jgi:cell wall-active antibiotic response 4TMS protein YvqF
MSWSGIILVIVGALLLANNFDLLSLGWLRQWWPAILIAVGVMSLVRPDRGRRRARDDDTTGERPRRDADPRP